jgi:uncharacterized membrane protein YfcA
MLNNLAEQSAQISCEPKARITLRKASRLILIFLLTCLLTFLLNHHLATAAALAAIFLFILALAAIYCLWRPSPIHGRLGQPNVW